MRTAIFSLLLLAAPALMGQSGQPLTVTPETLLKPQPDQSTVLMQQTLQMPQAQDWWTQQPSSKWRGPLLAQNRPFEFAIPKPQTPLGKMEPIPTQWPNAKFEGIPTRWQNLKVVPAGGMGAAVPGRGMLFVQPGRK